MGELLGLLGLVGLVVSLVGLVRGHIGWARLSSRKAAAAAAVGSLVVVGVGTALSPSPTTSSSSSSRSAPATPTPTPSLSPTPRVSHAPDGTALPDRTLTPGSVLVSAAAVVCAPGYATSVSVVGEDLRRQVLAAYAIADPQRDGYELDHLIPVELGGDNGAPNLWPQPRTGPGNAAVKNGLESHLHELVCAGAVPLTEAQQAIAADWSAANARYGSMPVSAPSASTAPAQPEPAEPLTSAAQPSPPATQPAPQRSTAPPAGGQLVVKKGEYCSPAGAVAVTSSGTPVVCKPSATDTHNRWR